MIIAIALTTIFPPIPIKWAYQATGHGQKTKPTNS
jgi:hypothetical protein